MRAQRRAVCSLLIAVQRYGQRVFAAIDEAVGHITNDGEITRALVPRNIVENLREFRGPQAVSHLWLWHVAKMRLRCVARSTKMSLSIDIVSSLLPGRVTAIEEGDAF